MKHKFAKSCFAALMLLVLSLPSFADDIFIRNRAYKGEVIKMGGDVEIELEAAAKALKAELKQDGGSWTLDGEAIQARSVDGKNFVTLESLNKAGYKVIKNPSMGTIDVHQKAKAVAKTGDKPKRAPGNWGTKTGPTLVYFGAKW